MRAMRPQAAADGTDGSQMVMLRAELASANAQLQMSNQAVSDEREVSAMLQAKVAPRRCSCRLRACAHFIARQPLACPTVSQSSGSD